MSTNLSFGEELNSDEKSVLTLLSKALLKIGGESVASSQSIEESIKVARRQAAIDHVKDIVENKREDEVCINIRKRVLKTKGGGRYYNYLMKVGLENHGKIGGKNRIKVCSHNAFIKAYAERDIMELFDDVSIVY